ncbi:MAG: Gfo/Idh/MocA family oxidoreductase [Candidatus Giovannonibacteria bacterium]|nr:MAG: Gfo/Idh/MocA family oxidoreductase [Candidatus Giovannonibacteria bacterium]
MKIGLIGFGSIGQRHYNNLVKRTKNVIVFSRRDDVNLPRQVKNWREFKKCGPYDGIIIANETSKHVVTIKKCIALSAGWRTKALFIEKPLSHNLKNLNSLGRLLLKNRISAFVGYCFHFFGPFIKIKKIIKSGKLGRIYYLRASVGQDLKEWRPGRDYRKIYSARKNLGGGVLLDLVHDINYPAWLLDDVLIPQRSLVKKISDLKINTEDLAESVFVGKKTGVIVSVHQDYLRIPGRRSLEIAGSKGSLIWNSSDAEDRGKMYQREINFFIGLIKGGKYFSNWDEAVWDVKNIEYLKKHGG